MSEYIDLTPTWQEILPTWRILVEDACRIQKPDQMKRFWTEMQNMAEAADKWNEYVASLESEADISEAERINEGLQP